MSVQKISIKRYKSLSLAFLLSACFAQTNLRQAAIAQPIEDSLICRGLNAFGDNEFRLSNFVTALVTGSDGSVTATQSGTVSSTIPFLAGGGGDPDTAILQNLVNLGIFDSSNDLIFSFGPAVDVLTDELVALGLDLETAKDKSRAAVIEYISLTPDLTVQATVQAVIDVLLADLPTDQQQALNAGLDRVRLIEILLGVHPEILSTLGVNNSQITAIEPDIFSLLSDTFNNSPNTNWSEVDDSIQSFVDLFPEQVGEFNQALADLRAGGAPTVQTGENVEFRFALDNPTSAEVQLFLPKFSDLEEFSLQGSGSLISLSYEVTDSADNVVSSGVITSSTTDATQIDLPGEGSISLIATVRVGEFDENGSLELAFDLGGDCGFSGLRQSFSILRADSILVDPFGEVRDCDGGLIEDYTGFQVALYETDPNDPTFPLRGLTDLTLTEIPDNLGNDIPLGLAPNRENANPFFLTNADLGRYTFLLDDRRNQLDVGRTYILVVSPPPNSEFLERRIRIEIIERVGNVVTYEAKAIDGSPLGALTNATQIDQFTAQGTLTVTDAQSVGLRIFAFAIAGLEVCQAEEIQITKVGDRIAAEPGDTVLYRINVRSLSSSSIDNLVIDDILPTGLVLVEDAVRAAFQDEMLDVTVNRNGRNVEFVLPPDFTLATGESFDVVYAAQVTPDGFRGDGENLAFVEGIKTRNNSEIGDGPAIHRLRIEPGIVADCGTLIGRVFVDKNFDGHQQPGEPGVPNAVIFLDDGNRIMTDADGLYSVANVLPGYHTGSLDLESVPGYDLAPNRYFIAENGQSRVARLEPGGLVRMNFAVTPAIDGEVQ